MLSSGGGPGAGSEDSEGFPGEGALSTFDIPLAFLQACVCWHSVSPGALDEVEDTGLWVLITEVRWVSFVAGQGCFPIRGECAGAKTTAPQAFGQRLGASWFSGLTDIQGGA